MGDEVDLARHDDFLAKIREKGKIYERPQKNRLALVNRREILYTPAMKYGDRLEGTIDELDQKGRGTFSVTLQNGETRRVVVPFTSPGDQIEATFRKRDQGAWIATLDRIIEASPDRKSTPCPHAGTCGGCLWQHLSYDAQLTLKTKALKTSYEAAGINLPLEPIIPCPDPFHYRNRMDYAIGWKGELGLKAYGHWNRYLDLTTCLLLDEETPTILQAIRETAQALEWQPWDAREHTGQFRYAIIRLGKNTGQRLIHLLVRDLEQVTTGQRQALIERLGPHCTSLILGENTKPTDISYAERCVALQGPLHLEEEVNGTRYRIHPNAFFQTNTRMAEALQAKGLEALGPLEGRHILDLYGGIGFFGVAAAKRGATVFGQELDAFAVSEAQKNAEQNQVAERCTFASGPVERLEASAWKAAAALIDPPRAGLHPKALEALCAHGPERVVYISCNYHSFLREWPIIEKAYRLERVEPLDLFPQTPHVEVVHALTRKGA